MSLSQATFGGGCFWCLDAAFRRINGVKTVASGYAGGTTPHPSYEEISTGTTGHAEVVRLEFDPQQIAYTDLLDLFFRLHDPTTLNRQGNDVGPQYRSLILYENESQKQQAEAYLQALREQKVYDQPIVTELQPLTQFYPAEYHQNYFAKFPEQAYCQGVIQPKSEKFESVLAEVNRHSQRGS